MKIIEKPIDEIKPYPNNPRINDRAIEPVANSIRKFGFKQPLVLDVDGTVVVGHTRLEAAKLLGLDAVPCVIASDLSPAEIQAYRLADNKTNEFAEWDFQKLSEELDGLMQDFDMSEFGFSDQDFDSFDDNDNPPPLNNELSDDYSDNIGTVDYEPKETNHKPEDLYSFDRNDLDKYINQIENEEIRQMLLLRKAWFTDFHFSKIADYYAYQATKEEQRAFEAMGLVLLDKNQMIQNGFADLVGDL